MYMRTYEWEFLDNNQVKIEYLLIENIKEIIEKRIFR